MRDYKNIRAFKVADELVISIYKATKDFPKEEIYGLVSQLRRAATSVPTNIAEGASRQHKKDYLNFLYIARASLAETEYLLHLANQLGYLTNEVFGIIEQQKQAVAKTLYGLIESVSMEAT
ncbi:MAG: four helix bundle protein [Candidatus Omnitrophica bacterium]|nr:four helix bundle protein [Candidatus Omnitrophota bacterium]